MEDNSSVKELLNKLKEEPITILMEDYNNMEKVGQLGFNLPRNDKNIETSAGDIILYQGKSFVIYYDRNEWSLTKIGKIDNVDEKRLKEILGRENVQVTISKA